MRFLVIGRDGDDADAPARRGRVRPAHLDSIQPFVDRGQILIGGAILDDSGAMIGSILLAEFDTREALDEWLRSDPYVTEQVWRSIEVHPFRTAVGAWMPDA
ncbi:MAG: YciI family protein [Actinomycetota bacterium]